MELKPSSSWVGRETLGSRSFATWSPVTWSSHQPGWWSKLLLFHNCHGAEDWLAVLETRLYVYRAGRKIPAQPAHLFDRIVKALNQDSAAFLYPVLCSTQCHPQLAKSLDFLWVGTETSRDWKERLKLHRGVHQQNQICAHLPVLASIIGPDQQPWTQWRTQKTVRKPGWRLDQKQNDSPGAAFCAPWKFMNRSFGFRKIWVWILDLPVSIFAKIFAGIILFHPHSDLDEAPHSTWRSGLGPELMSADSSTRALSPASYCFHVLLLWMQEKVLSLLSGWRPWEKPLSERPLSQKRSMTIVRGGVTACWFSF